MSARVAFICYLILLVGVGWYFARRVKTQADFVLAGRGLGAWVSALTHQATALSGWLYLAFAGLVYKSGFFGSWLCLASGGAPVSNFLVLSRLREYTERVGALTIPDYLEARYYDERSKVIRWISVLIIVICMTVYTAGQYMAAGKAIGTIIGWNYNVSAIVSAIVITLYTLSGGFFAVAWTDFFQGLLMIIGVLIAAAVGLSKVGGLGSLLHSLHSIDPKLLSITIAPVTAIGYLGASYLGYLGQPQLLVRFMAVRDPETARKALPIAATAAVLMLYSVLFAVLSARVLFPQISDPELALIQLVATYFPGILAGVIVAGAMAAIMSTADSLLICAVSSVVRDLYNRIFNTDASEERLVAISRIVTIILGLGSLAIALRPFEGVLWVIWWAWGGLTVFGPPAVLGVYWRKATREGCIAGLIGGFLTSVVWFQLGYYKWLHLSVPAFAASLLFCAVVSLLTKEPPKHIQEGVASIRPVWAWRVRGLKSVSTTNVAKVVAMNVPMNVLSEVTTAS